MVLTFASCFLYRRRKRNLDSKNKKQIPFLLLAADISLSPVSDLDIGISIWEPRELQCSVCRVKCYSLGYMFHESTRLLHCRREISWNWSSWDIWPTASLGVGSQNSAGSTDTVRGVWMLPGVCAMLKCPWFLLQPALKTGSARLVRLGQSCSCEKSCGVSLTEDEKWSWFWSK